MSDKHYKQKRIHIKNKQDIQRCKELSVLSNNLYNRVNYIYRQILTNKLENISEYTDIINNNMISDFSLMKKMRELNDFDFRSFPHSSTAQIIIMNVYRSYKSFFQLIKKRDGKKHNLPLYIKQQEKEHKPHIIIRGQDIRFIDDYIVFPRKLQLSPIKNFLNEEEKNIIQIQITCENNEFYYRITYDNQNNVSVNLDKNKALGIDVGVNNILTCVDTEGESFIVDGKHLKSINRYYNKKIAEGHSYVGNKGTSNRIQKLFHKRNNVFINKMHEISNQIIKYCVEHNIGRIVVGKNKEWKQNVNLGRVTNQHFVQIPHATLLNKIKYKAESIGIIYEETIESHTSKCDALAKETIEHHDEYAGKRTKRGQYKSSTKHIVNADVNGALNILRKSIGDDFIDTLNKSKLLSPYKIYA